VLPLIRLCDYIECRAVVAGGGATVPLHHGATVMIIIGIIACIAGLCALAWLLFNLAVFGLPFFAGVSAGMAALHSGAGPIGAILVGLLAGGLMLALGQIVFTLVPSIRVRVAVALLFAVPAAIAGYHAAHGLAGLAMPSEGWRQAFAIIGALVVGATALARLVLPIATPRSPRPTGGPMVAAR